MPRPIVCFTVAGSLCGVLAGCASTGTPAPDPQPSDRIVMTMPGSSVIGNASQGVNRSDAAMAIHATDSYIGISARINGPAPSIMDTLSGVYRDLGIPIATRMSTTGQIGNRSYKVPGHRLKNIQLSQVIDCGQGTMAGRPADVDQITLNVISTIKPATDSGSVVNTYVSGLAQPYTANSDPVHCASNGVLERMINDRLVRAFGGAAAD
jgi:hypothetical protein